MVLLIGACGGSSSKGGTGKTTDTKAGSAAPSKDGLSGVVTDTSKPTPGGSMTVSIEAETATGYCLPEATLAAGGLQTARAIYDYLTVPDKDGNYVPYLADKVTPNADFTSWSIHVRPGIKFSDGSPLDAQVVMNNLNAYRGNFPEHTVLLFKFVFQNITNITMVDNMTVKVDMAKPWVTFPSHLYQYGRLGIMGQAQLDSKKNCAKNLVGTGPFELKKQSDWVVGNQMTLTKNPNYWRKDKDGQQLPYLDTLIYKPTPDPSVVTNGLQSHAFDLAVTDSTDVMYDLKSSVDGGQLSMLQSAAHPEVTYTIFNTRIAPFNNILAREAYAYAYNKPLYNQIRQHSLLTEASGPFGPGTLGYLPKTDLPSFNLTKAKSLVQQYKTQTGKDLSFTLTIPDDPASVQSAQVVQGFMKAAGITMQLHAEEQQKQIGDVIYAGLTPNTYQASAWRNHPGFDPDDQYVWWHCDKPPANQMGATNTANGPATQFGNNCDNLVNFTGFNDSIINQNLEAGRETADLKARETAYNAINQEFAKQVWSAWGYYTLWSIPAQTNVRGLLGPNLPTATSPNATGAEPFTGLSSGTDVSGLWKKN